jgi:hypothetical protein
VTSRGMPTLTESKRAITFLPNDDHRNLEANRRAGRPPPQSHPKSNGGTNWISATKMIVSSAAIVSTLRISVLLVLESRVA